MDLSKHCLEEDCLRVRVRDVREGALEPEVGVQHEEQVRGAGPWFVWLEVQILLIQAEDQDEAPNS